MLTTTVEIDQVGLLRDQLGWHFREQLRPRFAGLTDEELHWEPVSDCWGVRRSQGVGGPGAGARTIDFAVPTPDPAPVTTIAWRLAHVVVGVFGARSASHFGAQFPWGVPDYDRWPYPGTAQEFLAQLDATFEAWDSGVGSLTADDLRRQVGPAEGPWADHAMGELVAHVNREAIHHLAEVALLRDLYARR